jgi:hypothetical protein
MYIYIYIYIYIYMLENGHICAQVHHKLVYVTAAMRYPVWARRHAPVSSKGMFSRC